MYLGIPQLWKKSWQAEIAMRVNSNWTFHKMDIFQASSGGFATHLENAQQ